MRAGERAMNRRGRDCPDCRRMMHPIRIVDKGESYRHSELEYAAAESARSFWTGQFPIAGRLSAFMCDSCGRVLFFAEPKD